MERSAGTLTIQRSGQFPLDSSHWWMAPLFRAIPWHNGPPQKRLSQIVKPNPMYCGNGCVRLALRRTAWANDYRAGKDGGNFEVLVRYGLMLLEQGTSAVAAKLRLPLGAPIWHSLARGAWTRFHHADPYQFRYKSLKQAIARYVYKAFPDTLLREPARKGARMSIPLLRDLLNRAELKAWMEWEPAELEFQPYYWSKRWRYAGMGRQE